MEREVFMRDIIVKRSNLNKIPYPQVEGYNIKRALTVKEAITKQTREHYDCVIIEATVDTDIENIKTQLTAGNALASDTMLVLLTEPDTTLNSALVQSLRDAVGNTRQVLIIDKYAQGVTYENILPEVSVLHNVMNMPTTPEAAPTEEKTDEDLTIAQDVKLRGMETDNEELLALRYKLGSVVEELRIAKEFIERMTSNPNVTELTIGGTEATRLYKENDALQAEIDRLKNVETALTECEAKVQALQTSNAAEQQISLMWRTLMTKVYQYGEIMKKENDKYSSTAKEAEAKTKRLQQDVADLQMTRNELNTQINALTNANVELRAQNDELKIDLGTAIETGNQLHAKIDELDTVIAKLTDDKRQLGMELNKSQAEIAKLSTYDVELLRKQATDGSNVQEILEARLRQAKEDARNLDAKNKGLIKELATARNRIDKLTDEKRILERLLDGETYGQQGIVWTRQVQARLIAFIGHGGQGCTSLVSGIAKRLFSLGKNVVIIDCDFRAPKMHAVFDVNPIIEYTQFPTLGQAEMKTSLGKILALKDQVYQNFEKELIINVAVNKKGKTENRIDLLSGLISMRNSSEISGMDLNSVCVELSAKYDYILVDLGRSEGSGGIARQQAAFMQNANRRFIVTNNNLECVKSVLTRLVQARIDVNTCEIVFNLVQERDDRNLQTITARVKRTYFIPFNKHMAGKVTALPDTEIAIKQIVATEVGDK